MVDLAEAGRRERDQPIAEPTPISVLARRAKRIRRRRRLTVAVPLIVAVVTAAAVVAATRTSSQHVVVGGRRSAESAPPTPGPGRPYLWLSATEVPTAGADLVAAIVNPSAAKLVYGAGGVFQRWTGAAWSGAGYWSISLPDWGGFGRITAKNGAVFDIGLGVAAHSAGDAAEYFTVPSLPVGWYRVGYLPTKHRAGAFGVFEVTASALRPAPVENPTGARLEAEPTLMTTGKREIQIVTTPTTPGASRGLALRRFNNTLARTVDLQHWDGNRWKQLNTLRVHATSTTPAQPGATAVTIPALPIGTYRLVRHSPTAGDLGRVLWIAKPLIAPTAPKRPTRPRPTVTPRVTSTITRGDYTVTVTLDERTAPPDSVMPGTLTVNNRGRTWHISTSICSGQLYQVSLIGPGRGPGGVPLDLCPGVFTIRHGQNRRWLRSPVCPIPAIGRIPLQRRTPEDLDSLYTKLALGRAGHRGLAPKTIHSIHEMLHKALADAERKGSVTRNWRPWPSRRSSARPKGPPCGCGTPSNSERFSTASASTVFIPLTT